MDLHAFFGAPIHTYTRAQAHIDGALVGVDVTAREAGFTVLTSLTVAAWDSVVAWDPAHGSGQDERGRLWDVLVLARHAAAGDTDADRVRFTVARVPNSPGAQTPVLVELVLHIGPGDGGEPVLTVMLPDED